MNSEGIHVELTVEGLGREAFARAFAEVTGWIWERVDVLFPVITGQWTFMEAAVPAGVLGSLMLLSRLVVHLADGGRLSQTPRAMITDPHDTKLATWRSYNQWEDMLHRRAEAPAYGAALGPVPQSPPQAPARERISALDAPALFAHDLFHFLTRNYVNYLGISVLICWIFGLGDLDVFFAALGMGGGS